MNYKVKFECNGIIDANQFVNIQNATFSGIDDGAMMFDVNNDDQDEFIREIENIADGMNAKAIYMISDDPAEYTANPVVDRFGEKFWQHFDTETSYIYASETSYIYDHSIIYIGTNITDHKTAHIYSTLLDPDEMAKRYGNSVILISTNTHAF